MRQSAYYADALVSIDLDLVKKPKPLAWYGSCYEWLVDGVELTL